MSDGLSHHGARINEDEDMSHTLENTVILLWLQMIHPGLPQIVKQRYGSELRNKTLATLKAEISQALTSLLDELRSIEDANVLRSFTSTPQKAPQRRADVGYGWQVAGSIPLLAHVGPTVAKPRSSLHLVNGRGLK